jgi:hypothetical protein
MSERDDYERNNAAYHRLKESIDRTYPKGWFIGIRGRRYFSRT